MRCILLLISVFALSANAQFQPASSKATLYFPHLADGGPPAQRWQTILTFTNEDPWGLAMKPKTANVTLLFYGDGGQPLALDFGSGARSNLVFSVPSCGTRVFRSRMSSATTVTGWAYAISDHPIQGTISFRAYVSSGAGVEIAAHGTVPTFCYHSAATNRLGVAMANVYNRWLSLDLLVRDQEGREVGRTRVDLAPFGHEAFTLWQRFPNLSEDFLGSVELGGVGPDYFLAWTMGADAEVFFSLPAGEFGWPPFQQERLQRVFYKVRQAANALSPVGDVSNVTLVTGLESEIGAWALNGYQIKVNYALVEFLGDSDSELAAVIAHEFGHIYQFRAGQARNEAEADEMGAMILVVTGYDPYAPLGALGRVQGATADPSLLAQISLELFDPHRSFPTRIADIMNTIRMFCAMPEAAGACSLYKEFAHPHLPSSLPLMRGATGR